MGWAYCKAKNRLRDIMIGTKGLSICMWLFSVCIVAAVLVSSYFFFLALVLTVFVLKHWLWDVPQAKEASKKIGLKTVVLLPINCYLACFLLKLSNNTIALKKKKAYEIHIVIPGASQNAGARKVAKIIEKDLFLIRKTTTGIFLWDTTMPIPRKVKKEIQLAVKEGTAFYKTGGHPIPCFPGLQLELKCNQRYRTHGGIIF